MEKNQLIEYLDAVCEGEEVLYACERGIRKLEELKEVKCEAPEADFDVDELEKLEMPEIPEAENAEVNRIVADVRRVCNAEPKAPALPKDIERAEHKTLNGWLLTIIALIMIAVPLLSLIFPAVKEGNRVAILLGVMALVLWRYVDASIYSDLVNDHNERLEEYRLKADLHTNLSKLIWKHRSILEGCIEVLSLQRRTDHEKAKDYAELVEEHNEAIGEYKNRLEEYLRAQREYMAKHPELLMREQMWNRAIEGLGEELESTRAQIRAQLDELYARSIIHPRCRSMAAAFRLREHLRGGDTLNGAYRKFALELRDGLICESVQELEGARERFGGELPKPAQQLVDVLEQLGGAVDALFEQIVHANEAVCTSMQTVRDGGSDDLRSLGGELDALRRQIEEGECMRAIRQRRDHFIRQTA